MGIDFKKYGKWASLRGKVSNHPLLSAMKNAIGKKYGIPQAGTSAGTIAGLPKVPKKLGKH